MRRIICLAVCAAFMLTASSLRPVYAGPPDTNTTPRRGLAVLSSSIGSDYSPEALANLVQRAKLSPVVIDWAWITYHWDRTNFAAINRFLELMKAQGVPVAAMYRPRFLDNPTVPIQVNQAGEPVASHGAYICFSSPEARQWGISWGAKILQKLPQITEIIIYNPLNQCQCPVCQEAARNKPYANYDAVWKFLAEAKATWRKQSPAVKLGVVFVNDPQFWKTGAEVLDVAHPFLFIMNDTDMAKDAREAGAIRDLLPGKMGSCLAKITWGPNDKVSPARLAEFDRQAAEAGLPYFFWTAETLFDAKLYDQNAVAQILRGNPVANASRPSPAASPQPVAVDRPRDYLANPKLPERAATLLRQIMEIQDELAALDPLIAIGKESDTETRHTIISAVAAGMKDKTKADYPRWLCIKVLNGIGDERALPDLIQVLLNDGAEIVRYVASEAVGEFYKNNKSTAAHDALLQAARTETSSRTREILARYLGRAMPAATPTPAPAAGRSTASKQTGDLMYSPEQIRSASAETFLERMFPREPGYDHFAAMNALIQKGKESAGAERVHILSAVIAAMKDTRRSDQMRFQCCYVLGDIGDPRAIPDLVQALLHDEFSLVRSAAAEALAKFPQNSAADRALHEAAALHSAEAREVLVRRRGEAVPAPPPNPAIDKAGPRAPGNEAGSMYEPGTIRATRAEVFLERMLYPEPGYQQFAALNALAQKAKESEGEARRQIISLVIVAMKDKRRPLYQRYQCCMVLSDCGDEQAVPDLIRVLLSDELVNMRMSAADALWKFYENQGSRAAYDALMQSARQENSPAVRARLKEHLGQIPAPKASFIPEGMGPDYTGMPWGYDPGDKTYTPEEIRSTSAETFLELMLHPVSGYGQFAAMNALAQKAKESAPAARERILSLVIATMQDKSRAAYLRYQCCYVLSGSGDERAVPSLIQVMLHDESAKMREVAAAALAKFPRSMAAQKALQQARRSPLEQPSSIPEPRPAPAMSGTPYELSPTGPPKPPPGPKAPVAKPLPWPFPGGQQEQHIFNNYQQATDIYIHCGLDFIHPAGTPVTAVDAGYVAAIFTNYPNWITHHFFIVTPQKGGNEGWVYTHLDPRTFTFKEGDFIRQGQVLGSLVDFSVGDRPGVSHLHLHYVRFTRETSGKVNVHSLLDPLYFFDWKDSEPPVFQPLRFVTEGTLQQFTADAGGVITVSGKVDILAAVADGAFPDHMGNLGVPVVMLSISDGTHTLQKLVVDHRGDVGDETQVKPLFLSYDEKKTLFNPDSFPRYQMLRVTKTDGDGRITSRDTWECWDTTARDYIGRPLWPDGQYSVNVYAWDIAGNQAVVGAMVQVRNR